jgi:nitroimidazol reductase NimA-like FMN-containing flavoprotein (pyridoxamine 5'-phosphate oxidase superfamily)
MHRNVRRKDRELSADLATQLLAKGEYGVLSTVGVDGQAYGVPLNYVYKNDCLYFHCALDGHKLENIKANNKVSFCVVGRTKVLPDQFSTQYESAIVFGRASEAHGKVRQEALLSIVEKYAPEFMEEGRKTIAKYNDKTRVIKVDLHHLSGKARK